MPVLSNKLSPLCAGSVLIIACLLVLSSRASSHVRDPFFAGGPDGVGGIPYAGGPQSPSDIEVPYLLTVGLVVDSASIAVPGVPLVVMSADGAIVATAHTDENGLFAVTLPTIAGLTISLPLNGVSDIPIAAGVPVLIVVP